MSHLQAKIKVLRGFAADVGKMLDEQNEPSYSIEVGKMPDVRLRRWLATTGPSHILPLLDRIAALEELIEACLDTWDHTGAVCDLRDAWEELNK